MEQDKEWSYVYKVAQAFLAQFASPHEWFANVHLIVHHGPEEVTICSTAKESQEAGVPDNLQVKLADLVKEHAEKGEVFAYVAFKRRQPEGGWDLMAIPGHSRETEQQA